MSNQSGVKNLWIGLMIIAGVFLLPEFFIFLIYASLTIWMLTYFTLLLPTCWRASISDFDAWKCWFAFTISLYFLLGCCWLFELGILGFRAHGWFYYFIMLMTVPWLSSYFMFHTGAYIDIASSGRYLRCRDWIYYDGRSIPAIAYNFRSLDVEGENNLSGYGTDGVDIFFKGEKVLGAEPRSFRCLSESGNGYWCDRQRVYFEGQVLENAKPDFFSVMYLQNQSIFGHCQGGLYVGANYIPEVDLATFHFLVDHWLFAKDKSNVYAIDDNKLRVIDVDVSSFKIFEGGRIVGDNLRAFVVISGAVLKIIPDADLHTLTPLDCGYVKDKYRVYYHYVGLDDQILISSADPASFVVTDYESTISDGLNVDAKDKFGHYYRGILLRNTLIEDE